MLARAPVVTCRWLQCSPLAIAALAAGLLTESAGCICCTYAAHMLHMHGTLTEVNAEAQVATLEAQVLGIDSCRAVPAADGPKPGWHVANVAHGLS